MDIRWAVDNADARNDEWPIPPVVTMLLGPSENNEDYLEIGIYYMPSGKPIVIHAMSACGATIRRMQT